jgi:uncharacterized protein YoxC
MAAPQEGPRKWLDFTVNVQSLVISLLVAAGAGIGIYFSVISDVKALQMRADQVDRRFERSESDMKQLRQDTNEKLNAIGQNVEKIRDYLLDNAAGQRPEIKRWTR